VRSGLSEAEEELSGLYEGQPKRQTNQPTAVRWLKAISRMEITITRMETEKEVQWHLTDLPPLLKRILKLLDLSPRLYNQSNQQSGLSIVGNSCLGGREKNYWQFCFREKTGIRAS